VKGGWVGLYGCLWGWVGVRSHGMHPISNFSSWFRFSHMLQPPLITLSASSPCHSERERRISLTALGSSQRQPQTGTTQCHVQSRVEADLGVRGGASTHTVHLAPASNESSIAGACLVLPRRLGHTGLSAVSTFRYSCSHEDGSSWLLILLAQTFSQTSSIYPSQSNKGRCKKRKAPGNGNNIALLCSLCYIDCYKALQVFYRERYNDSKR
jgi:hypothetical protein